jgi:hypothetical protein
VFPAYLTTFLIEPGYEEPIKTVTHMLASKLKFPFFEIYEQFFTDTSKSTETTILKNALRYPIFDNPSQLDNWLPQYFNNSQQFH